MFVQTSPLQTKYKVELSKNDVLRALVFWLASNPTGDSLAMAHDAAETLRNVGGKAFKVSRLFESTRNGPIGHRDEVTVVEFISGGSSVPLPEKHMDEGLVRASEEEIASATEEHGIVGAIEIDEDALASHVADGSVWVEAWVHIGQIDEPDTGRKV